MAVLPIGIAVEVAKLIHTGKWEPLPVGANFVGHRSEGGSWVLIYDVAGTVYERRVAQWRPRAAARELTPEERRSAFRAVRGGKGRA